MSGTHNVRDVIIIGSGPAGLTAALYNARANLAPLMLAGGADFPGPGGQLMTTTEVENFPGFPEGVMGPDLMEKMFAQAERFGAEVVRDNATRVDFSARPFKVWIEDQLYQARSIIISTGAQSRRLGLDSESKYWGKGVTPCATCDGAFFRGMPVAVIGGGDSAMEEATFLTRFATRVFVVHRRDELRASKVMQQRALDNAKIEFVWSTVPEEVVGDGQKMSGLKVKSVKTGQSRVMDVKGLFLAIGHVPNTEVFRGQVELDEEGYVAVDRFLHTNVPGVFAAGDVADKRYRQAITAAGMGCAAALEVERYLAH